MRTSNKILLGFIILCFLIPTFLMFSFKSKINNGRFTIAKQEGQGSNFRNGNFKPCKVIKFVSPEAGLLKATIKQSDSLYYSYYMMNHQDSIKVTNVADTLVVELVNYELDGVDYRTDLNVTLKLPSCENLIIDNAEVMFDSTAAFSGDLSVVLNGAGKLNIGRTKERRPGADENEVREFPYSVNRLAVKMNGGELSVGSQSTIQQMDLRAEGQSAVIINNGAVIQELSGSLSEQSSVKATWKYLKRLAALTNE